MIVAIVVALALALIAVEYLRPGRRWPRVTGWWARALAINGFQIVAVFVAGATWERWLRGVHVLDIAALGFGAELAIGYAVNVVWLYWSHRARHAIPVLWRWLHRLHHSPERVEILTAFYKHPLEIVGESIASALLLYGVLGVSPGAAFAITTASGIAGLFYHWNIATPRWLGYVVQRPESHCVHHQTGVHAYNYSELPIVDMMFGTFRNPARFDDRCGLPEARFIDLLVGRER